LLLDARCSIINEYRVSSIERPRVEPLILAVETSSRTGSLALALGEKMLAETAFSGPARHSAELFPAIKQLLGRFNRKLQEIEQIYVSIGPGSFTGLRIATTLAKIMHLANAAKIVAVDTLDVIAANAQECKEIANRNSQIANVIAPILDAKRNQFFIAVYQYQPQTGKNAGKSQIAIRKSQMAMSDPIWKKILPDALMTASEFIEMFVEGDKPIWLLGDGLLYHKDKFKAQGIRFLDERFWSPRASKVHELGWQKARAFQFADPVTLTPNYLRRPDIKTQNSEL